MQDMKSRHAEMARYGYQFIGIDKIGRNDKCPCGSDRKFKKCCIEKVHRKEGQNFLDIRA